MGNRQGWERLLVGYLMGLGLAIYAVAWKQEWSATRSSVAVALLSIAASGLYTLAGKGPAWRGVALASLALISGAGILAGLHFGDDPPWLANVSTVAGGDAVLWQVQATFLSVGFAGLAIAAQLFTESPLAMGASRDRVLKFIRADWFAGVGLVANGLMAVEVIWLQSDPGVLFIMALGFLPTVALLLLSTTKLMQLFGHPSRLDEVVRTSLVETLANRLETVSQTYAVARRQADGLFASGHSFSDSGVAVVTLQVPVPEEGLIVKAIRPHVVRKAITSLEPRATAGDFDDSGDSSLYTPAQVTLDVEPGDRTRLGETAFRVRTTHVLDRLTQERLTRDLQSAVQFEPRGAVTPYEETDREIANLKDVVGTSIRAGAYATAERALEMLGRVVRGVWTAHSDSVGSSRRSAFTRRDWLFRSIGDVELDATLSRRAADMFVGHAMTRALEAPRVGSPEYVDECLRSFTRLWHEILRNGGTEFESVPPRITVCVQNLASYGYSTGDQAKDLQARATWAMVELVKLAIDAGRPDSARLAALELSGLFEYADRYGSRVHVRGGQLVLSGWLEYLADKQDVRDPDDPELRSLVTARGTWSEILQARTLAERGAAPFSRWDWWEMTATGGGGAQVLELSHYIDQAQLAALASSYGPLPSADNQELASEYKRFLQLLDERDGDLTPSESRLKQRFTEEVARWDAAEDDRLAQEPLSPSKIAALKTALREALSAGNRLAAEIPTIVRVPEGSDSSRPILGMNFRVPRHYLVEKVFNQTYANPEELGRMIARGFNEGEERRILEALHSNNDAALPPTVAAIRTTLDSLGDEAKDYVLVTPYGGLTDIEAWYSTEFREVLSKVKHVETAALEKEAILFDRRSALMSVRQPEEKAGLRQVEGTTLALGIFDDVVGADEPQVRIETGEFFVVWRRDTARVFRFGASLRDELAGIESAGPAGLSDRTE
jgi:hypothetical protein